MASKRNLKKSINYICSELFAECVAFSLYVVKDGNTENVEALLHSILVIHNDYVCRISHPEPGMQQKQYFNVLVRDFNAQISEIIDQIANMN